MPKPKKCKPCQAKALCDYYRGDYGNQTCDGPAITQTESKTEIFAMRGIFVVLEGVDGCGKSTQIQLLAKKLTKAGFAVATFRDPGSTQPGEQIRDILLSKENNLAWETELFLYAAARSQCVRELLLPAINNYDVVLMDRYFLSTIAYQGHGSQNDLEIIRSVAKQSTCGLLPDITFILDLPADKAFKRISRNLDRMEAKGLPFFKRVRDGYLTESANFPIKVIDALQGVEAITQELLTITTEKLVRSL